MRKRDGQPRPRYLKQSAVLDFHSLIAHVVAKHIAEKESSPCNKATALRNEGYRAQLDSYIKGDANADAKNSRAVALANDNGNAPSLTAQLETANLRRENDRLKAYIASLDADETTKGIEQEPFESTDSSIHEKLNNTHMKYVRTCQALHLVLRHMEIALSTNVEKRQILDLSRMKNNIVVDATIATPFFEWLDANRGIGGNH